LTSNRIRSLAPLQHCTKLQDVHVGSNHLTPAGIHAGLKKIARTLDTLNLTDNNLENLDGLPDGLVGLGELYVARNHLTTLKGSNVATKCPSLETFDMGHNLCTQVENILTELRRMSLVDLILAPSPMIGTTLLEEEYRSTVCGALPSLQTLDGETVSMLDRHGGGSGGSGGNAEVFRLDGTAAAAAAAAASSEGQTTAYMETSSSIHEEAAAVGRSAITTPKPPPPPPPPRGVPLLVETLKPPNRPGTGTARASTSRPTTAQALGSGTFVGNPLMHVKASTRTGVGTGRRIMTPEEFERSSKEFRNALDGYRDRMSSIFRQVREDLGEESDELLEKLKKDGTLYEPPITAGLPDVPQLEAIAPSVVPVRLANRDSQDNTTMPMSATAEELLTTFAKLFPQEEKEEQKAMDHHHHHSHPSSPSLVLLSSSSSSSSSPTIHSPKKPSGVRARVRAAKELEREVCADEGGEDELPPDVAALLRDTDTLLGAAPVKSILRPTTDKRTIK